MNTFFMPSIRVIFNSLKIFNKNNGINVGIILAKNKYKSLKYIVITKRKTH
jgi:hypothetical protein